MARFKRIEVARMMDKTGIVPVFYHPDYDTCLSVIEACYKAGIRVFEFTNRGDFAHELFGALQKQVAAKMPEMMFGIGTVIDAGTASLYMQLGADFVVSPVLVEEMAQTCNRRKVMWIPGAGSLTEISNAEALGAEVVKIFPGTQVGGPDFVKAALGPFPWSSIMPTGGVTLEKDNLTKWFKAGVVSVGIGSSLFTKEAIANKDWKGITEKLGVALNLVSDLKKNK